MVYSEMTCLRNVSFCAGVGTGGTIQGAGQYLRHKKRNTMLVAVEPDESPVLSGGRPGHHQVQNPTSPYPSLEFSVTM